MMRPRRRRPEQTIQRALFAHIAMRGVPGLVAFHPANGGARKPVEAAIMKGLGGDSGRARPPALARRRELWRWS
jgi:hypothetical protein